MRSLLVATCVALVVPPAIACAPRSADLEARLEALEDSVALLSEAVAASVDLKPGDPSYSVLRLDVGSLAMDLESVIAFGAGTQVNLLIANLTSAEIDAIAGTLWWGLLSEDGTHLVDRRRSKLLTLTENLPPGVWTRVVFALDSVPPEEIGFLRLSRISATGLRLAEPSVP